MQREPDDGPGGLLRLHLIKKLVCDEVGRVADGLDVVVRDPLAPDGLPDAALRGVPDAAAFRTLLAARELGGFQIVPRLHDELVIARAQEGCEVGGKGRVATYMLQDILTVAEDFCPLVAGSNVKKQPLPRRDCRDCQHSAVPEHFSGMQCPVDPRELRFRRKRNENPAVPGVRSRVRFRDGIVPEAV